MRLFALAILVASSSAWACPDLSGTFAVCSSASGNAVEETNAVVTQTQENGGYIFTMEATEMEYGNRSTTTIIADGAPRTETEDLDGTIMVTTTTATCDDEALIQETEVTMNGMPIGAAHARMVRTGNTLVTTISGQMMGASMNETITCK